MNFFLIHSIYIFIALILYLQILEAIIKEKKHYISGHCTDSFNQCHHVCIPNPDNNRQFYCTCRSQYYIQKDGFSCMKTPPKDLEMDFEINQGTPEEKTETVKPTPRKSTGIHLTRSKRFTRHRFKTAKPNQQLPKGKCTPTSCKNGGICQSMKSSSGNSHLFSCLCRLGYDGLMCERSTSGVQFPKFTANGYLAFPERILNEQQFRLSLYVKPVFLKSATVVAFKNSALSYHFLLGIEGNKFVFRFENIKSRKEIRHQTVVLSAKDRWYKVEIDRKDNDGKLFVDDIESILPPIEIPKDSVDKYRQTALKSDDTVTTFICDYCFYLGGHPQLNDVVKQNHNLFGFIESPYLGCMRNLVIEEHKIDMRRMPFYGQAVEGLGIEDCSIGLCDSITCENKGECQISIDYQPTCHCDLGFSGKSCTKITIIKLPSFNGESYASYRGLRGTSRSENHIFIRFKPLTDTGILLYQGYSSNRRGDFLSIYLINGYPWISYDLGSGTISIRSKRSLKMDEWHTIRFDRIGRKGTLLVNDDDNITGYSPGEQFQLTIKQNLLLGGIDSLDNVAASLAIKKGFKGCIQMVFVDHQQVNLVEEIEKSRNLANCDSHTCGDVKKTCWQDGECIPDNNDFVCSCPLGFVEAYCQTKIQVPSIRDPSFNGSSYLVYTDQAILSKFSDSKFSLSLFLNLRVIQSNRFIILATRTSSQNNDRFFSLKINAKSGIDFVLSNGVGRIESNLLDNLPLLSHHKIYMLKDGNTIQFHLNDTLLKTVRLQYNSLSTIGFSKLFLGGSDLSTAISLNMPVQSGIVGCIRQLTIDAQPIRVSNANDGRSVAECGSTKS